MKHAYSIRSTVLIKQDIKNSIFGELTGGIRLNAIPAIGSRINIPISNDTVTTPVYFHNDFFTIAKIIYFPLNEASITVAELVLEDLVCSSVERANDEMRYLVKGFNFDFCHFDFRHFDNQYNNQSTW